MQKNWIIFGENAVIKVIKKNKFKNSFKINELFFSNVWYVSHKEEVVKNNNNEEIKKSQNRKKYI